MPRDRVRHDAPIGDRSLFVLAPSTPGYFGALTVETLASANSITLTRQRGEFVGAGTDQIFTGMYVR